MKTRRREWTAGATLAALAFMGLAPGSCGNGAATRDEAAGRPGDHRHAEEHGEEEHDHGPPRELSFEEIGSSVCEHDIPQLDCDECRYELGVVKVPPSVQGSLVKTTRAEHLSRGEDVLPLACEIQADDPRSFQIVAPVSGRVVGATGTLGQSVKDGDVLATLYSDEFVEIRKTHLAAHQAEELAAARLARLTQVQENLKALVAPLQQIEGPVPDALDPGHLLIGRERAEIIGRYSEYATAKSRWDQEMKRISDTRTLLARLTGKGGAPDTSALTGAKWKEVLLTSQAELRRARKTYERAREMVEKGVASRQELDDAERDLDVARAKFQAALETVRLATDRTETEVTNQLRAAQAAFQAALDDVALKLDIDRLEAGQEVDRARAETAATHRRLALLGFPDTQIDELLGNGSDLSALLDVRAPAGGEITSQSIRVGQTFERGDPLFVVADLSQVWVWCGVYDSDLASFLSSDPPLDAELSIGAMPGRRFPGVLDTIGRVMDEQTRTVRVRIVAPNPEGVLRPGMFATAYVKVPTQGGHPLVPSTAVLTDEGQAFVFKPFRDGYWVRRNVTLGRTVNDAVEILGGVALGDVIVTEGAFLLKSD
ncbi:MAG: efflux RND transporter periplasmic adaptor subunit, partial [Deltaproteobacteria bacterium]|nr:efflux RND transporter periplasmic adaptor subunit [Deltaproteobacteria bacterium]